MVESSRDRAMLAGDNGAAAAAAISCRSTRAWRVGDRVVTSGRWRPVPAGLAGRRGRGRRGGTACAVAPLCRLGRLESARRRLLRGCAAIRRRTAGERRAGRRGDASPVPMTAVPARCGCARLAARAAVADRSCTAVLLVCCRCPTPAPSAWRRCTAVPRSSSGRSIRPTCMPPLASSSARAAARRRWRPPLGDDRAGAAAGPRLVVASAAFFAEAILRRGLVRASCSWRAAAALARWLALLAWWSAGICRAAGRLLFELALTSRSIRWSPGLHRLVVARRSLRPPPCSQRG